MFPASTKGGGQAVNFPDVCKTPAPPAPFVPTPFPNLMQGVQLGNVVDVRAANGNKGAKIAQKQAIDNVKTIMGLKVNSATHAAMVGQSAVPRANGDEPGTLKGMISSKNMSSASFKSFSSKVMAVGKKAVSHLTPMAHNGGSANTPPGAQIAPSQTKVILSGGSAFNPMAGSNGVDFTASAMEEEEEELQM